MFLERSSSLPKLDSDSLLSTEDLSISGEYLTFINNYSISLDSRIVSSVSKALVCATECRGFHSRAGLWKKALSVPCKPVDIRNGSYKYLEKSVSSPKDCVLN